MNRTYYPRPDSASIGDIIPGSDSAKGLVVIEGEVGGDYQYPIQVHLESISNGHTLHRVRFPRVQVPDKATKRGEVRDYTMLTGSRPRPRRETGCGEPPRAEAARPRLGTRLCPTRTRGPGLVLLRRGWQRSGAN